MCVKLLVTFDTVLRPKPTHLVPSLAANQGREPGVGAWLPLSALGHPRCNSRETKPRLSHLLLAQIIVKMIQEISLSCFNWDRLDTIVD